MAANKAQDEKNMKILRQLSNEPENKKCMDCGIKGTVYVCSNFNTFICTACSGLHREFNHRVKSISMTTFKPEEIKNLQAGGNAVARKKWLAKWTPEDFPEPDPSDSARVKAFMKLKYVDKRWYSETGEGPQPYVSHHQQQHAPPKPKVDPYPSPVPLTTILGNDIPPLHINGTNKQATTPPPHTQPQSQSQSQSQSQAHHGGAGVGGASNPQNLVDWNAKASAKPTSDLDELLSIPSTTQQQAYQQQQQQNMYQHQQHMVMSQFGAQPGWGAPVPPPPQQAFFSPYGAQGFGQTPQPGFFGGVQQTPPNFFTPPPAQPANPYQPAAVNGAVSPTFGQPTAANPYGLSPSPTPLSQPNAFGATMSPAQPGFGATLSPAQPNAFGGSPAQPPSAFGGAALSPALHSGGGFAQSPALNSTPGFGAQPTLAPAPAPAPAAQPDKFDIFASLSPLNNPSNTAKPTTSFPSSATSSSSHSHTNATNNPNPFGDPFGANPSQNSHSQPAAQTNSDPFGFSSPALASKPAVPATSSAAPHANGSNDPFGFGSSSSPAIASKPAPTPSNDPFGFDGPSSQQQSNNANPFGANPFGGQQPQQPPVQNNSAFAPFNANPFGQQPLTAQPAKPNDPWGNNNANPFF